MVIFIKSTTTGLLMHYNADSARELNKRDSEDQNMSGATFILANLPLNLITCLHKSFVQSKLLSLFQYTNHPTISSKTFLNFFVSYHHHCLTPPLALIAFAFHMNLLFSRAILTTGAKGKDRILRQHKKEVFYQRDKFIAIIF